MTIIEAIERSKPTTTRKHHLAIRRMCWVAGRRIQWNHQATRWMFGNAFEPDLLGTDVWLRRPIRECDMAESQGCLTPESLTALDWEVVL